MNWEIDPIYSHASFSIQVMRVSTTRGHFNALLGHLYIDEQNPVNSWVDAEVNAASINTHNKLRDTHLRSAQFFAVKKHPTIIFQSTNVEYIGGQDYKVTGNLTLLGVTKPFTFDVTYNANNAYNAYNAYSGQNISLGGRISLTAKAKINRNDFGLGRGRGVQFAASEIVTIEIELEAVQQPVEAREAVTTTENVNFYRQTNGIGRRVL